MTAKIRIVGGTSPGEKAVYIDGQKLACVAAVEFRMTARDTEVVLRVVGDIEIDADIDVIKVEKGAKK